MVRPILVPAALAALALAAPITAVADPMDVYGPPPEGIAADSPSSWDIPGAVIVDADDDLSDSELEDLLADVAGTFAGVRFEATDLEEETRIKIVHVGALAAGELVQRAKSDPRVEGAEPLAWVRGHFHPNDPRFAEQWHMDRVGAPSAWDYATGRGVTVAVVDTCIACEDHDKFTKGTDLAQTACVGGWNLIWNHEHANDDHGHGTHVAGTIAQSTNNGLGVTGLAFHARLMPVKVLDKRGWGTTADVANGIRWAADNGAQVINLSLGGPRNSDIMQKAVDHARSRGAVVVASAGNSGGSVGYPGANEGVIGVSASDQNDKLAYFSSRGRGVDIAAPGVEVVQQTICNEGRDKCEQFAAWNGTSMASPHVAGAAALLVGMGISDPEAVERRLAQSARVVDPSENGKRLYGAGILDAAAVARRVSLEYGLLRLGLVVGFTALAVAWARKQTRTLNRLGLGYWLAALITGPGLLFFAPLVLSRVSLPIDLLARPFADLDFYVGAGLHRLLPLATAVVPFGLMILTFQSKAMRSVVAGTGVGTAAYLASVLVHREAVAPIGWVLWGAWLGVNLLVSLFIARTSLAETK